MSFLKMVSFRAMATVLYISCILIIQSIDAQSQTQQLPAPTGVSATDGTYADKIQINWNEVKNATGYSVYRGETGNSSKAALIAKTKSLSVTDTDVSVGKTYYYWIKAVGNNLESPLSTSDSGYAKYTGGDSSFSATIDTSIQSNVSPIPGKNGKVRNIGVLEGPDGSRINVVEEELVLRSSDEKAASAFVTRLGGTVIYDGTIPEPDPKDAYHARNITPSSLRSYLINVPLANVTTGDMGKNASTLQMEGKYRCSSENVLKLLALALSEKAQGNDVHLNLVFEDYACPRDSTQELPLDPGAPDSTLANEGYLDAFLQPCFNDPGIQLLDAWELMELYGDATRTVSICIMDRGFNLNDDFTHYQAYDFVGEDYDVNAAESGYHGMGTLSISCAEWDNRFGSVGTGAPVTWPMIFRHDGSWYTVANAIRTAVHWGAEIVSMSFGADVGVWGWLMGEIQLDDAVNFAYDHGVILLVAGGNDTNDLDSIHDLPLEAGDSDKHPIGVGAIDLDTKRAVRTEDGFSWGSNYGSPIDIWAPGGASVHEIITTPDPNHTDYRNFGGTSCACPYVAGVVAMMRAVNPDITPRMVHDILRDTANYDGSVDTRVYPGYIDAYSAVREALQQEGALDPSPDSMEPNNSPDHTRIEPGSFCANMYSDDMSDCYWFYIDDYSNVEVDIDYLSMGSYYTDYSGGELSRSEPLAPGNYFLNLENRTSEPTFYRVNFTVESAATIDGDRYEPNNVLEDAAVLYFPLSSEGEEIIYNELNFHVSDDHDYYELVLPALPDDMFGYNEVVTVYIEPDSTGSYTTFHTTVYDESGESDPYGRTFELTDIRERFPDGHIRFCVYDFMHHRNFYRMRIGYDRDLRGIDPGPSLLLEVIPIWLENLMAAHPRDLPWNQPGNVPLPMSYPSDPETLNAILAGYPPTETPEEILMLRWEQTADFGMEIHYQGGGSSLTFRLLNATGEFIGEAIPGVSKSSQEQGEKVLLLDYQKLPRGMYGIKITGNTDVPIPFTITFGSQGNTAVQNDTFLHPVEVFSLGQNVPNPFNSETDIPFILKTPSHVEIIVYNLLGERVRLLTNGVLLPGQFTVRWNGTNDKGTPVASGVYFVQMITQRGMTSRKMTLLK